MTRAQKCIDLLLQHPAQFAQMLGYEQMREDLHGEWIRMMVLGEKDMTLQAHRGSYKTTCLGVAIAILMMLQPQKNIIFLRKTDSDVVQVIKSVDRILTHEATKAIYKEITGKDLTLSKQATTQLTLECYCAPRGASQLLGMGINASLTGKHADIVITDDIVNIKDRASHAERQHTKAAYMELQNIRNRGGRIVNTGTPWHKEDAFTIMPPPRKWNCYETGLITPEKLEEIRHAMTPSLFAANYELQHIASSDALFTTPPQYISDPSMLRDGIAHIDASYGGQDYTAFTCGRYDDATQTLYMYGRLWHKHVDKVLDLIIGDVQRLMVAPIHTENNGDKGYLKKELLRRQIYARQYHEHETKTIKIASYLLKWWPKIKWLQGTDKEYIDQIMDYTEDAEHDDAPDSAACICRLLDKWAGW